MALSFDASEGELLTIDSQRSLPAPFLTKTYQLVDDPSSSHIVSWGEDGTTFIVWRPAEFARDLLPNYFKHNNFSSFVRQLNTYGFRKIVPDRWEFANEFFRKGEKHLLSDIHRRKASQQACTSRSSPTLSLEEQQAWSSLSSPHSSQVAVDCHHALIALSDENERLRRDNTMLSCELSRLKKLYGDVVMFIQQHVGLPYQDACKFRRMIGQSRAGSVAPHTLLQLEGNQVKHNSGIEEALNQSSFCISFAFPQYNEGPTSCIDDDKERELTTQASSGVTVIEDAKALPKLFGVPLQGKKRLHPESDDSDGTPTRRAKFMCDKLESINSSTNLKMDLALELRPSPLKAPWLKLCS